MVDLIYSIENFVCGFPLVIILMGTHIYFSFKLKFPQKNILQGIKYMILGDKKNTKDNIIGNSTSFVSCYSGYKCKCT